MGSKPTNGEVSIRQSKGDDQLPAVSLSPLAEASTTATPDIEEPYHMTNTPDYQVHVVVRLLKRCLQAQKLVVCIESVATTTYGSPNVCYLPSSCRSDLGDQIGKLCWRIRPSLS
jgi:hypothetical protein